MCLFIRLRIDSYDPQLMGASRFIQGAQYVAANAAVAVDGDADGHGGCSGRVEESEGVGAILLQAQAPAGHCPGQLQVAPARNTAGTAPDATR